VGCITGAPVRHAAATGALGSVCEHFRGGPATPLTARFATSARAVDMLGRQQIATVPTAISELFKNAYDAYARRVRADYYPKRRALLLRDDGVGMSQEDFLQRWLVLGTDSKAADSSRPRPPKPAGVLNRPTMGEKGIGRLAVAAIGPQVLVVTRPDRGDAPRPTVVALVQWSMFEIPGLLLEEVDVPLVDIDGAWPSQDDVDALVRQVLDNLRRLGDRVPGHLRQRVTAEVTALAVPEPDMAALAGPVLADDGHGTHFLVAPVHEELDAAMTPTTDEQRTDRSTDFERLLIGFTNTMLPGTTNFPMRASFFVHRPGQTPDDLIAPNVFWEPEDFALVDHDIEGEFDETGRFTGSVSVYGQAPTDHVVVWPATAGGRATRCGPFRLRIGYLQGDPKESRLDQADYAATQAKLARIGGLYVYRDGIRVLPYGSADVDYLGIEERRSRNAAVPTSPTAACSGPWRSARWATPDCGTRQAARACWTTSPSASSRPSWRTSSCRQPRTSSAPEAGTPPTSWLRRPGCASKSRSGGRPQPGWPSAGPGSPQRCRPGSTNLRADGPSSSWTPW
jgi:hypothetical protein